ncbi:MAG TPA: hypothetical protein VF469_31250, partial [Kofleriaceae bacterium]
MRNVRISGLGALLAATALIACSDHPYDPDAPAVDPSAPRVHITQPARGTFAGDVATLVVTGTAIDDSGVAQVQVNGVDAVVASDGSWTATIPVHPGTQLIHAVARDAQGNIGKESRAVVAGPMQPIATAVPRAITAAMSAQTIGAIGRGITSFLTTGDLEAVIAPHNPVIDVGGGPDCLYAQAAITHMSVGSATRVALAAQPGGLGLDVELDQVAIGMHLSYAALCADGSRDVTVTASHIQVTGIIDVGVNAGAFDVKLVNQHVQVTGFHVDLGGVPGDVVKLLHLDTALASILSWATEQFVVPVINTALAGLGDTRTIAVLGTPVDVKIAPSRITFDSTGAIIELDAALRAHGDAASPGYVFASSQAPAMSTDRGFTLAVADDTANQLLGSFWAARGMDRTFDLTTGSYGDLGKLYDRVELAAAVPPFVDASGGALELTIGDLVATFKSGNATAAAIAVSAQVAVKVVTDPDGKPRLDVGTPTTYVDILDENVDGSNVLSNAQFEVLTSFALARVIAFASGSIGAIPVPSLGGVAVHDLAIAEQTGYLVID